MLNKNTRSILVSIAAAIGGVVFIALAALLIATLAHFVPREGVADNLRASQPIMDKFKRADSFTECLNLGAALVKPSLAKDIFGFEKLSRTDAPCPALKEALQSDSAVKTVPYARYWNGPVVLVRVLFALMPYMGVYVLFALLTLAAFGLWAYALMRAGVARNLTIASTLLIIWGGGFVFFGGNVAHAPAFFLPLLLLGFNTLKTRWWENETQGVFLASCMGALTLWLDMLFEGIPFNALLLGLSVLLISRENVLRRLIIFLSAFGFGVAAMIGLKLLTIIAASGMAGLQNEYLYPLQHRMAWVMNGDADISYWKLISQHLPQSAEKIFGKAIIYWLYAAAGVAALLAAIVKKRPNLASYALLIAVVPVWYALFPEHSWEHSGFSTQLLFWPWALMLIALAHKIPEKEIT